MAGETAGAQDAAKQKAGEVIEQARGVTDSMQDRVAEQADVRSTQAGEQAESVGDVMHGASQQLRTRGNDLPAAVVEQVATRVDELGRYLRETDGRQIIDDVQDFAREQPWLVAAVGLAAGVAAARLLKSSGGGNRPARGGSPLPPPSRAATDARSGYNPAAEDAVESRYPNTPPAPETLTPGPETLPPPPGGVPPYPTEGRVP